MEDCIFCKIREGKLPAKLVYQDEDIMVFPDINPIKPVHLLIVPKKHFEDLINVEDHSLFGKVFNIAQKMVKEKGLENKGYKVVVNGGGAQIINHLHFHLVGPLGKHAQI